MSILFKTTILVNSPPLSRERFDALLPLVSKEKQERIKRFRSYRDAQNCLLGDMLARAELQRVTGLENRRLVFSANEYGKPFLLNFPRVHYNISHAGHFIALAVDDEPVGIDIEQVRQYNEKIAERFFAADEISYIVSAPDNLRGRRFTEIWTKKEACIKREGRGLAMALPSFSVLNNSADDSGRACFHKVYDSDEAICYVCGVKRDAPVIERIGADEIEIR